MVGPGVVTTQKIGADASTSRNVSRTLVPWKNHQQFILELASSALGRQKALLSCLYHYDEPGDLRGPA